MMKHALRPTKSSKMKLTQRKQTTHPYLHTLKNGDITWEQMIKNNKEL